MQRNRTDHVEGHDASHPSVPRKLKSSSFPYTYCRGCDENGKFLGGQCRLLHLAPWNSKSFDAYNSIQAMALQSRFNNHRSMLDWLFHQTHLAFKQCDWNWKSCDCAALMRVARLVFWFSTHNSHQLKHISVTVSLRQPLLLAVGQACIDFPPPCSISSDD